MSIWEQYDKEKRQKYIKFLQIYGALSKLFHQKQGDLIPYLNSKFQETVFNRIFETQLADNGNTPHDVVSVLGEQRIGIGIKTWTNSQASFQKVMQIKRHLAELSAISDNEQLAYRISEIKNDRLQQDYDRLGLSSDKNIYHYVTRDQDKLTIQECAYIPVNLNKIKNIKRLDASLYWTDDQKEYKFSFADSQILQKFDSSKPDNTVLEQVDVKIIDDPFAFLLNAYQDLMGYEQHQEDIVEIYLPLYSYRTGRVEEKSGLNAWNGASKNKGSDCLRPEKEIYIPIPIEFHKKFPHFFCSDITPFLKNGEQSSEAIRFNLVLPNGQSIPALLTQENKKALQSGSTTEINPNTGKHYGQSELGEWLLVEVLKLPPRTPVTLEWLHSKELDSVRLWRKKDDYSTINIDFAPIGSFERFMGNDDEK